MNDNIPNPLQGTEVKPQAGVKSHPPLYIVGFVLALSVGVGTGYLLALQLNPKQAIQEQTPSPTQTQNQPQEQEVEEPKTFIYSPQTGGLTLELDNKYSIIVNVDGNKGGAAGAAFKVATVIDEHSVEDSPYAWVQVDIDNVSGTIQSEANIIKDNLAEDGYENIKSVSSKVDGKPAIKITATAPPYAGPRTVYVVRSGEFVYTFTGTHAAQTTILKDVLKAVSIVPKGLRD